MALNVSEDLTSMVESVFAQSGMLMELGWIRNIVMQVEAVITQEQYALDLELGLNDSAVIGGGYQIDLESGDAYAHVPQINTQWIGANLNEMFGEDLTGLFQGSMVQSTAMAATLAEELPEAAAVEAMVKEFVLLAVSKITQVESLEETVTLGGMEQKYTVLKATLTQQEAADMIVAILEKAQTHETLRAMVEAGCNYINGIMQMGEEVSGAAAQTVTSEDFYNQIPDLIEEVKASVTDPEKSEYLYVYVDKNDQIRGYAVEDPESQEKFSALTVWDGDSFAFEAVLPEGVVITGSGTEVNDVVNGVFDLMIEDVKRCSLELKDLKTADGKITGTLTLIPGESVKELILNMVDGAAFAPLLKSAEFGLEMVLAEGGIDLNVLLNDSMLFGVDFAVEMKEVTQVETPTDVVFVTAEDDLYTWLAGIDVTQVFENLSAAGVPGEYVEYLQQILYMMTGIY